MPVSTHTQYHPSLYTATSTSSAAAVPVSRSTSMSGAPLQHSPKAARPVPKSKALTALRHLNVVMEEDRVFFVIDGRVENCATVRCVGWVLGHYALHVQPPYTHKNTHRRDDALLCQHCLLLQTPEHFAVCSGVPLRRPLGHIVHEITGIIRQYCCSNTLYSMLKHVG